MAGRYITSTITNLALNPSFKRRCTPQQREDAKTIINGTTEEEEIQNLLKKQPQTFIIEPAEPTVKIEILESPKEETSSVKPSESKQQLIDLQKFAMNISNSFINPKKIAKKQKTEHASAPIETKNSYSVLEKTNTEEKMEEETSEHTPQPSTSNSTPRVNEKTQEEMYTLKRSRNKELPKSKLSELDVKVNQLNPGWPNTVMPRLTNNVYFTPKLLHSSAVPKKSPSLTISPQNRMTSIANQELDSRTIEMQKHIIRNQWQLLELERKEFELELLQQQVKSQEQMNIQRAPTDKVVKPTKAQNILLKQEVGKQMANNTSTTSTAKKSSISVVLGRRLHATQATSTKPRTAPVNSALIADATSRSTRVPRLLRHQHNDTSTSATITKFSLSTTVNTNVLLETKTSNTAETISSNNKDITSKVYVREKQSSNSLESGPFPTKSKFNRDSSKSLSSYPFSLPESGSSKGFKSSFDSPNKNKISGKNVEAKVSRFATVPLSKCKQKEAPGSGGRLPTRIEKKKEKPSFKNFICGKIDQEDKSTIRRDNCPSTTFKDITTGSKSRNYIRCNREHSLSPETVSMDVVLRSTEPPEKQARLQPDITREKAADIELADNYGNFPRNEMVMRSDMWRGRHRRGMVAVRDIRTMRPQRLPENLIRPNVFRKPVLSDFEKSQLPFNPEIMELENVNANIENSFQPNGFWRPMTSDFEKPQFPFNPEIMEVENLNVNMLRPNGFWRPMTSDFEKPQLPFNPEIMEVENVNANIEMIYQNNNPRIRPPPPQETPEIIVVGCANQDNIKSIVIDNGSRDIRYYDDTAVVFMNPNDPREIIFQNGLRKVFFGDKDVVILGFNEPFKEVSINGKLHSVKLGGPSRELHIDDKWYECLIGGAGIRIELDGEFVLVKVEGPPPFVEISQMQRIDLVAGKINIIVDVRTVAPLFLNGKIQQFDINGQTHTLRFVNSLQMALIDNTPFDIEFGGLPKPFVIQDKKHYIRFSVLPKGIKPGQVNILGMENISLPVDQNEPALPILSKKNKQKIGVESPDRSSNSNSPLSLQNLLQQQNLSSNLKTLSSLMDYSLMPSQLTTNINSSSYQVKNNMLLESSSQNPSETTTITATTSYTNTLLPNVNINELFQKLVATGIVTTVQNKQPSLSTHPLINHTSNVNRPSPVLSKKEAFFNIKPVDFGNPKTLKVRQPTLLRSLYSGMQCGSCGMRFLPECSMQYSQHLDWHFRQNRKAKKNIRKAGRREWYYSLSDWKKYEEIEDLGERQNNYFENQRAQAEGDFDEGEEAEIPSVPAEPTVHNAKCEVCQDRFDHFYNEEKEEWHLRMAISVDGRNYHPLCYEDYQKSLMNTTYEDTSLVGDSEKNEEVIPGLEVSVQNPDTSQESERIKNVIDDDESQKLTKLVYKMDMEEAKSQNVFPEMEDEGEDDDVIIDEPVPEIIDLIDDDKYEETPTHREPGVGKEEYVEDEFMNVKNGIIKAKSITDVIIKTEPMDADDLQTTGEGQLDKPEVSHTKIVTSIDGNVEFDASVPPVSGSCGKIKINITKPLPVIAPKGSNNKELNSEIEIYDESIELSQPLPSEGEPLQINLKLSLQGVKLKKMPHVKKDAELTGLCSIM